MMRDRSGPRLPLFSRSDLARVLEAGNFDLSHEGGKSVRARLLGRGVAWEADDGVGDAEHRQQLECAPVLRREDILERVAADEAIDASVESGVEPGGALLGESAVLTRELLQRAHLL